MHIITVTQSGCECDCGFNQPAMSPDEAQLRAYFHAEQNTPAFVNHITLFPVRHQIQLIEGEPDGTE